MPKKALLFDIDGTLVDSNEHHVSAWVQAFSDHGFMLNARAIHDQIGKGSDNFVPSLLPDAPKEIQDSIGRSHGEIYKRDYIARTKPFPEARELLVAAKRSGKTVILASSASRSELDHYVRLLDAADIIDGATSKDDVAHSKPCPDIFEQAVKTAGVRPGEAIVIGDTPYDIIAARRSGIDAIALRSGGFDAQQLTQCGPVAIYDDVAALLAGLARSPICR